MSGPLTADQPLVPPTPPPGGDGGKRRKRQAQPKAARRRRRPLGWLGRLFGALFGLAIVFGVAGAIGVYGAYLHFSADLPDVDGLRSYQPRVMSRVYASDAHLVAELATERRIFVPFSAIPEMVKQAFVSAEDQNFWIHRGVDPLAILRAAVTDLQQYGQGRRPVGASTITQQVAKNILLDNSLSLARKAREAILAFRIENSLTKERILELYLNEIYLGLQSYGVAAAAQAYFNKTLDELSLPEAAFLAALPKAPNNYNPFRFPEAAKARRDWAIDRMAEDRVISPAQAAQGKASPIVAAAFRRPETVAGGDWFGEEVRRRLVEKFGADTTTQGGLMVRTSLDPALQIAADHALRAGLMSYDRKRGGWRGPVAHLDVGPNPSTALRTNWAALLGQTARPPGMLPEWKLAVVLETIEGEGKLGWLEPVPEQPRTPPRPRTGTLLLADLGWARPVHEGKQGAVPRRISDVVQPGDVVMVEPAPQPATFSPSRGRAPTAPERTDRILLRQVPQVQGALVSLDPATGRVLAMVGGWSFELSQFNRATQANRQPGSAFKPMVYLTALQAGISPSQRFLDAPIVVDQGAAGRWRPNNYGMDFNGPVPLRVALQKSLNLVTLRVADRVGMEAVAQTAIAFHVVDNMPRVLPAALGAVETTVLRMAGAYASLSTGGREVIPTLIESVQDRDGRVVWRSGADANGDANGTGACEGCTDPVVPPQLADTRKQIADPASVFQLVTMMQGVVQNGTGYAAGKGLNRPIAGKTGTSQDFNDAWFVGFTADLVTAVWIGFDTPASLGSGETGGSVAAPIWHDFMAVALKDRPVLPFPPPQGVNLVPWGGPGGAGLTDAFKPDQVPGASAPLDAPLDSESAPADATAPADAAAPAAANGERPSASRPTGGQPNGGQPGAGRALGTIGGPSGGTSGGGAGGRVDSSIGGLY